MTFEDLSWEYYNKFGEKPPIFSTLDENNELYLEMLEDAIDNEKKLTLEELEKVFVIHKDAIY